MPASTRRLRMPLPARQRQFAAAQVERWAEPARQRQVAATHVERWAEPAPPQQPPPLARQVPVPVRVQVRVQQPVPLGPMPRPARFRGAATPRRLQCEADHDASIEWAPLMLKPRRAVARAR